MKHREKHQVQGLAAATQNPGAAALARAINSGGGAAARIKSAVISAQLDRDWTAVASIENSLSDVRDRTVARRLQNVGSRALVVSRKDDSKLGALVPEGFEFGLAWLVALVFLRTDGEYWEAMDVADEFTERMRARGTGAIFWGTPNTMSMCAPTFGFSPSVRCKITDFMARDKHYGLEQLRDHCFDVFEAQEAHNTSNTPNPLPCIVWGCFVAGASTLDDLFDEDIWCPGLDLDSTSEELAKVLAEASVSVGGDTFVHPRIMGADEAMEFAQWMAREQSIKEIASTVFRGRPEEATAQISLLEPKHAPYLDQILVAFFNKADMLDQTLRFPRSGNELEEDRDLLATKLAASGFGEVTFVQPAEKRGANEVKSMAINHLGEWVDAEVAHLGPAGALIRQAGWINLRVVSNAPNGSHLLPSVQYLERCGVSNMFGQHYQPTLLDAIKEALMRVGDPDDLIEGAVRSVAAGQCQAIDWLLRERWRMFAPERMEALALQYKLCEGAMVVVTPGLLQMLDHMDIGGDCPAKYIQPGFEQMYLSLNTFAAALDDPDDPDGRCLVDGVMVQRWTEGEFNHLVLDVFLRGGGESPDDRYPFEAVPIRLNWTDQTTLGDLRKQIGDDDGLGQQVLDLYAGVTLYMNSRDARTVVTNKRKEASEALNAVSRKKRKKHHYEALNSAFDSLQVGPEQVVDEAAIEYGKKSGSQKSKKGHYRRGFLRVNQRVGKGRSQTRPTFIPPVLVNANKLAGGPPTKREYKLGT